MMIITLELHHVAAEEKLYSICTWLHQVIFHRNDNAATENVSVKELKHILDGDLFKINTPLKIQARKSTETFLDWCLNNEMDDLHIDLKGNLLQV